MLSKAGATKIIIDNKDGLPSGLTFCIIWRTNMTAFALPCNSEGVLRAMKNNSRVPKNLRSQEQALRVSWRILKEWIAAQLAIVEAELCQLPEVFLPYAVTKDGDTMFNYIENRGQNLLGPSN
jgi:hypothetical protein